MEKEKGSSYEGDFFKDFYNSQGDYSDAGAKHKEEVEKEANKSRVVKSF